MPIRARGVPAKREPASDGHGDAAASFGASSPCSLSVDTVFVFTSTTRMRWLFVSATYSVSPAKLRPPGSLKSESASQPAPSPRNVLHERLAGSITLILLLYV